MKQSKLHHERIQNYTLRSRNLKDLVDFGRGFFGKQGAKKQGANPQQIQLSVWEFGGQNPHCKDLALTIVAQGPAACREIVSETGPIRRLGRGGAFEFLRGVISYNCIVV